LLDVFFSYLLLKLPLWNVRGKEGKRRREKGREVRGGEGKGREGRPITLFPKSYA
jgi:hypothetical protein